MATASWMSPRSAARHQTYRLCPAMATESLVRCLVSHKTLWRFFSTSPGNYRGGLRWRRQAGPCHDYSDNTVSVLRGNREGTFSAHAILNPHNLAIQTEESSTFVRYLGFARLPVYVLPNAFS